MATMRAIVRDRYGGPDVLRLEERPTPEPRADQVLVRVRAASLNTADLDHLKGMPRIARVGTGMNRPRTPFLGFDMAGDVEAVGPDVTRFRPGDGVWADLFGTRAGSFSEYVCVGQAALLAKPPGLAHEAAATLPHSGILALQALHARRHIHAGQHVLVNGAGGCVGPLAVQIARSIGAEVTGVDHTDKLEFLRAMGADHVIDYTREDLTRNGQRYDLILDIAANRSVLGYRRSLRNGGVYVQIARTLGGFFSAALVGGLLSLAGNRRMGVFTWVPNRATELERLGELMVSGEITPVVDRRYPLAQVPEALRRLQAGLARGKVVITT